MSLNILLISINNIVEYNYNNINTIWYDIAVIQQPNTHINLRVYLPKIGTMYIYIYIYIYNMIV